MKPTDNILKHQKELIEWMKQAEQRAVDIIGKPENRTFKLPNE